MIEGAIDALQNGLVIAPAIRKATQDYRDDMDTVGQFIVSCIEERPGENVRARFVYDAYRAWCRANAKTAAFETKFGRVMKSRIKYSDDGKHNFYCDIGLKNVPADEGDGSHRPHPADDRAAGGNNDLVPI